MIDLEATLIPSFISMIMIKEEIKNVKYAVRNIDTVLSGYIKYKNDDKAYSSWLEKQIKESTEKANEKAKK